MLEQKIEALTAAVDRLADVFAQAAQDVAGGKEPATAKSTAPAAKPAVTKATAPVAKPVKATAPAAEEDDAVDFEAVREVTRRLGTERDRDTVVALLKKFKVAKASELKSAQYADYVAQANALLTEVPAEEEADLV